MNETIGLALSRIREAVRSLAAGTPVGSRAAADAEPDFP